MKFKRKMRTIIKKCPDGERYTFKNGVAIVPGMRFGRPAKNVKISLKEFNNLVKENT